MLKVNEKIINVHWDGPFKWDDRQQCCKPGHVLYQIYGSHHLYGRNILLYIGMTKRDNSFKRLSEHTWIKEEYDDTSLYLGSMGNFNGWQKWNSYDDEPYEIPAEAQLQHLV